MAEPTPYDTGERLEPKPWVPRPRRFTNHPDDYGRVDFTDDEDATIATVHIEHQGIGRNLRQAPRYILKIQNVSEPIIIQGPGGEYLGTVKPEEV